MGDTPMKIPEPDVDRGKLKRWAKRVTPEELSWLRGTVDFAWGASDDLKQFIAVSMHRTYGRELPSIAEMLEALTTDEIIWFCDGYKRPPQHEKRNHSRSRRYRQIRSGRAE